MNWKASILFLFILQILWAQFCYADNSLDRFSTDLISSSEQCNVFLSSLPNWQPHSELLDQWIEVGVTTIRNSEVVFPESLPVLTRIDRWRNELVYQVFKRLKSRALNSTQRNSNISFMATMSKFTKAALESPFRFLLDGIALRRLDAVLKHKGLSDGGSEIGLHKYSQYHLTYLNDIEKDKLIYGVNFFDPETKAQGAINTFAIKLFAELNQNQTVYDRPSANAISLLHPIVDRAMDEGVMTRSTFGKLQNYLYTGVLPFMETDYEKLLFGYLNRFETSFPRQNVPAFWMSLQRLFEAQIRSMAQKTKEIAEEDYYRISLDKGGLSTVLAAYTALGPLTAKQYEFFYRSGGIFQVIDDLLDIQKDLQEGVQTIWTQAIQNNQSFSEPLKKLLKLEAMIEMMLPELTQEFRSPEVFKQVYQVGFEFSLLRALARQEVYLDASTRGLLKGRLSLSLNSLKEFMSPNQINAFGEPAGSDLWLVDELIRNTELY